MSTKDCDNLGANTEKTSAPQKRNVSALIAAAGMSSRMKSFKPMLPIGVQSIIERQISTLRAAGCAPIVVVTGNCAENLKRHLAGSGVEFVHNGRYRDTGMLDSIKIGLRYLTGRCDGVVFTPVDIPMFSTDTVTAILRGSSGMAVPVCKDRSGHPIYIRGSMFPDILAYDGPDGLRGFQASHRKKLVWVRVDDPAILLDADRPEDYMAILKLKGFANSYGDEDCLISIALRYGTPPDVMLHCAAVAARAVRISEGFKASGLTLDIPLVYSAAMLHDIARSHPNHASTGAQWLHSEGLHKIADIVGCHHDLPLSDRQRLTEKTVVYYADKTVSGREVVTLKKRFEMSAESCNTEEAKLSHKRRYEQAVQAEQLIMRHLDTSA